MLEGGRSPPPSLHRLRSEGVIGGLRGVGSPPLQGLEQHPGEIFFGPYIRLGRPNYGFLHGLHTWFWTQWFSVHGFGCDGFQSMVLDALACINMYCNIEKNIMKNQIGSPGFGIQGKSLCICVLCVMLSHCLFSVF